VGPEEIQGLLGGVAVGDEAGEQALLLRLLEDGHRPLGGDERFVVSGDHGHSLLPARQIHQVIDLHLGDGGHGIVISQGLGGDPVLAIGAVVVATQHAERQGLPAGQYMKERLLLDGVTLETGHVAPWHLQCPGLVEADLADAFLARGDAAVMAAGVAMNPRLLARDWLAQCAGNRVPPECRCQR
jgi:hypothetical protein